jgi:hypothetical protein
MQHDTARIPLMSRWGEVKAYALVDADDYEWASRWRWTLSRYGYALRRETRNGHLDTIFLHREILGLAKGDERQGDHINRDRLDNRRANLRAVPRAVNQQNISAHRDGSSQYRGVYWNKADRKWQAHGYLNRRSVYLGQFDDEQEAGRVASEWRRQHMPDSYEG